MLAGPYTFNTLEKKNIALMTVKIIIFFLIYIALMLSLVIRVKNISQYK